MKKTTLNITSTVLEKSIDAAKGFIGKLIGPAVEESGLLIKDHIAAWRFKNQVKTINKAKLYCEKNGISPKQVSFKLLCPLLEYAGMEENEELQDKWAILLGNLADSDQNIENHVFPYILSQMSINEFKYVEQVYDEMILRKESVNQEIKTFRREKPKRIKMFKEMLEKVETQIGSGKSHADPQHFFNLNKERIQITTSLEKIEQDETLLVWRLKAPQVAPQGILRGFETMNLIRLGLIKEENDFYNNTTSLVIPGRRTFGNASSLGWQGISNVRLDLDAGLERRNILTELGELFIKACQEKSKSKKTKPQV